jgi:hypothetical protein
VRKLMKKFDNGEASFPALTMDRASSFAACRARYLASAVRGLDVGADLFRHDLPFRRTLLRVSALF